MLPPGDVTISAFTFLAKLIPGPGYQIATWLKTKFGGYIHAGNMRYLTNCQPGNFEDVKVLYTVSFFYRLKALVFKSLPFSKLLSDHSISVYSKKLMIIAFKRNSAKMEQAKSAASAQKPIAPKKPPVNNVTAAKAAAVKAAAAKTAAAKALATKTAPAKKPVKKASATRKPAATKKTDL